MRPQCRRPPTPGRRLTAGALGRGELFGANAAPWAWTISTRPIGSRRPRTCTSTQRGQARPRAPRLPYAEARLRRRRDLLGLPRDPAARPAVARPRRRRPAGEGDRAARGSPPRVRRTPPPLPGGGRSEGGPLAEEDDAEDGPDPDGAAAGAGGAGTPARRYPASRGGKRCVPESSGHVTCCASPDETAAAPLPGRADRPPPRRGRGPARPPAPPTPVCWLRHGDGLVGWGVAAVLRSQGAARFSDADKWWTRGRRRAGSTTRSTSPAPAWSPSARSRSPTTPATRCWSCPEVVVGRRGGTAWVTTVPSAPTAPDDRASPEPTCAAGRAVVRRRRPQRRAVDDGRRRRRGADQHGRPGEGRARPRPARDRRRADRRPLAVAAASPTHYPICWTFHVDGMFGATPEMLVRRERGPGHLSCAGRHHPPDRRRRARPGARRPLARSLQGPRGARVRRALGRRTRWSRTAPR